MIEDCLRALVLLFLAYDSVTKHEPGLWSDFNENWQITWSCALLIPVILRRRYSEKATYSFIGLVIAQLLAGPSFVFADLLAPVMLYSVIVHGNQKQSKTFILLAVILGSAAAVLIPWSEEIGPIFGTGQANDTHSQVYLSCHTSGNMTLNSSCANSILQYIAILLIIIMLMLTAACFMAYWTRSRRMTTQLLRERNAALAAREEAELNIARTAERARIARDMHDVVAHTLSTIIIQSDAGRYAESNDPAAARTIMKTIANESLRAQHDMEGLLGTFGGAPHNGYEQISGLVAQANATAQATNGSVKRIIHGHPQPRRLTDNAQSTIFHTVQEALTNARKYAGKGAEITVTETWEASALRLSIHDNGNGSAAVSDGHHPGFGLVGMRERIQAVGGNVQAGPALHGGFDVDATIPFDFDKNGSTKLANTQGNDDYHADRVVNDLNHPNSALTNTENPTGIATAPHRSFIPEIAESRSRAKDGTKAHPRLLSQAVRMGKKHSTQSIDAPKLNWVERISRFFASHYVLSDTLTATCLMMLIIPWNHLSSKYDSETRTMLFNTTDPIPSTGSAVAVIILSVVAFVSLALRRRFPQSAALMMLSSAVISLMFCPDIPIVVFMAPISLHSVCLYGTGHSRRWSSYAALIGCILFALRFTESPAGYPTLFDMILGHRYQLHAEMTATDYLISASALSVISITTCLVAIGSALWTRTRGTNAIVLESRRQAMEEEFAKQQITAANNERERISAEIRGTINETLAGVIDQANNGLALLDSDVKAGNTPSPQTINEAFKQIGEEGRSALADMRQLLRMLRETGGSDNNAAMSAAPLHPVQ
ncbi:signal transduction histidine kinase [Bifidobacterium commune]|uniref:sensor histidine kinase n=1 Tax=Bifidobacterium commune TaxID=1505727 RepID=UPI001606A9D1|nr:histidine kinase [Bifidobacterium commune]MBB2955003.1 signal transduction histidine kinase [Bifidobacterium commune]